MANGWRTVLVEEHKRLELLNDNLVIRDEDETKHIALEQVRDLIFTVPYGSITLPLLQRLTEEKINVVFCDSRRTPSAILQGLNTHTEAAGRLMDQAAWTEKRKAAVWKQVVRQKIHMQAALLQKHSPEDAKKLERYAAAVRLSDHTNREGLAAKLYFQKLFGAGFIRHAPDGINAALNYGYTILCTAFSRMLTLHGYQPALGFHHCGRSNPVNLSCDLMEPFRPFVDCVVAAHPRRELDWEYKQDLIAVLQAECSFDGMHCKLMDAAEQYTLKILRILAGEKQQIGGIEFA